MTKLLLFAVAAIALSTNAARALDCRRLSRLLGAVTVLTAVFVSFSDRARAEDEDCSKLFKSDYLREVCRDVGVPSHRQSYVKMECSILKAGHPSPSLPRSSKVIADTERALQDCINQYPDLGPLQPAPTPATRSAYTKGMDALDRGDFDAAIAEFTAAITKDPRDPFSYIRRATAYEKKRANALAIADYRKVLTLVDEDTGTEFAAKIRKLEMSKVGVPGPRKPPARPARNLKEAEPLEE
jgi:tetratricopeptide (TPR) repeat protein